MKFLLTIIFTLSFSYTQDCETGNPDWPSNNDIAPGYEFNLYITAQIFIDGIEQENGKIAGFVDSQIRGTDIDGSSYFPPADTWLYQFPIYSNEAQGESISFKFYDEINDIVINLNETYNFVSDGMIGDAFNPFVLTGSIINCEEDSIEGRWHFVGYEDNVMYQYVDDDEFSEGGLRWTLYSTDGNFGDLEDAGGTPNPYIIDEDIITIDLHFGNIATYEMNFRCDGQVVDFYYYDDDWEGLHSTYYREFYNYNDCLNMPEECFDLSGVDFGWCDMFLGAGWNGYECEYFSGCDWVIDEVDYSDYFFDTLEECQSTCELFECEDGEINDDDPCMPMECIDGEWIIIIIDCAEDMGVPCEGGLYIPPDEDECCSECILFGDINYDYNINILDVVEIVQLVLNDGYNEIVDINYDGIINVLDIIGVIQIILD